MNFIQIFLCDFCCDLFIYRIIILSSFFLRHSLLQVMNEFLKSKLWRSLNSYYEYFIFYCIIYLKYYSVKSLWHLMIICFQNSESKGWGRSPSRRPGRSGRHHPSDEHRHCGRSDRASEIHPGEPAAGHSDRKTALHSRLTPDTRSVCLSVCLFVCLSVFLNVSISVSLTLAVTIDFK